MKCKKCGSELFMYDDSVFECRNGGCEWHGWVLDPEMVALMDGKDAFDQYRESLAQLRSEKIALSNDLGYLTDICRFLVGGRFHEGVMLTADHADTLDNIVNFMVSYDNR